MTAQRLLLKTFLILMMILPMTAFAFVGDLGWGGGIIGLIILILDIIAIIGIIQSGRSTEKKLLWILIILLLPLIGLILFYVLEK